MHISYQVLQIYYFLIFIYMIHIITSRKSRMKIRNFTNRVADVKKALLRKMGSLNNELFWGLAESLAVALSGAILLIAAGRTHE